METRANHIWVGGITLILLAVLAWAIIWLARLDAASQRPYDIFFRQSVSGLAKGSEVTFAGVPAGQVAEIELWKKDPEFVRVRITVDQDIPILIGTTATIQSSFTGVSSIILDGAVGGAPPLSCPEENPEAVCPEGVPAIPPQSGGLGAILSDAPLLVERLATLTERLNILLSDKNQESIEAILDNTERMTGNLADASPEVAGTLTELQATLAQANETLASFEKTLDTTDNLLNKEGGELATQLKETLASAKMAADSLEATLQDARPATRQLAESTLPTAEATLRDLRETSAALRNVTEKIDQQGAGALVSGSKLPDYEP